MSNDIIGREYEQGTLRGICEEREARLVAIYGRRRVGKTYLVKKFFDERFDFFFTGLFDTPMSVQLTLFGKALEEYSGMSVGVPKNWFDAFSSLNDYLKTIRKDKIVVFLDELPWMDTAKSNFLSAFTYFWNTWGSTMDGLKLIVCGSATTWMLDKIIGDRGGLYGRTNRSIYLAPFNLHETERFLIERKHINWTRYQMLESYMVFGGIPYYLDMLDGSQPFSVNVDSLFFRSGAPLAREYDFLFRSLFRQSASYKQVVKVLAAKKKGLTQAEIKDALKISSGGALSTVLDNLDKCDFIRQYAAYRKKERGTIYQLTDLYCLFYLTFIDGKSGLDEHYFTNLQEGRKSAWAGYAFEQVALRHIRQIRQKLSIGGVMTNICSWQSRKQVDADGTEWPGAQIDLLLCRNDNVINVCEMKFSKAEYVITAAYDNLLRQRTETFRHMTKTTDALQTTFVTTYGLAKNKYSADVQSVVTMEDLFKM